VIRIIYLFLFLIFLTGCSFNKNSKFWTSSKEIKIEKNFKEILKKNENINEELNPNFRIKLDKLSSFSYSNKQLNNEGRFNFDGNLKKISRYSFKKIKNFYEYEPQVSFNKNDLIFFDNKGSILKFNDNSKLIWKKNYYSKSEKKQNPILQFENNKENLIVADNVAKYYLLDLKSGNLVWSKNNLAPFNSQIKIHNDKFFIIDFSNTLRCYSIKNGDEIWNVSTQNSLIRSKKKLSMIIHKDKIYFNNSLGDITAVDIEKGQILWQLPTQSSLVYESSFSLETSDIIADDETIYFSNNNNQFFSIDIKTGSFKWKNKLNSSLRPIMIGNLLFTITLEGYLAVIEKKSGNIIRVSDVFKNIKLKKRKKIRPTGFIAGLNNIYLSTSNGRLLIINIETGKTISTLKIDNDKISTPFVKNNNLFVIKDNAIIKLN
tara:strand:+ start:1041 stop:2336 length:1296 start_codon:yes stop_codon:yes gene_type:complete